ncbi:MULTISPECIES: hypothetical protein [Mycolicibacter]|uniref:Uncharacterized protein n=2 Tax=Mycolicibacter TaxID=1073531 RepID=A0ABU5XQK0_9MYCO|nr:MULTISPECIES: hypothetical protein [unclassified Mycolicibacter]MEB3023366.1 hypothetical protein [Mycolicibacter sp. MYC098]MEB3033708.1 hypothetical protein [Mycolicibacter sp. MYC340]
MWNVRFLPEAWINDYAVGVDPEGPDTFAITDEEAVRELQGAASQRRDWDHLRDHASAPEWIRHWHGPFSIELVDPHGQTWPANPALWPSRANELLGVQ